jgi:16S rRNA (uracil1498-N3)-methyltransferase
MIRLFVHDDLRPGGEIEARPEQSHYLAKVMRLTPGGEVRLFNGRDGEWVARAATVARRGVILRLESRSRLQTTGPDLDLIIALVKRTRLETIVEKAAELGVRRVRLVTTARTNADHTNLTRLFAIGVEAAEQTGRLDAPEILPPRRLDELLDAWTPDRGLMFCDEAGDAPAATAALAGAAHGPFAVLIGPEGGFTADERRRIRDTRGVIPVSLGPRILRADTAAISALTLWQAVLGDWRGA